MSSLLPETLSALLPIAGGGVDLPPEEPEPGPVPQEPPAGEGLVPEHAATQQVPRRPAAPPQNYSATIMTKGLQGDKAGLDAALTQALTGVMHDGMPEFQPIEEGNMFMPDGRKVPISDGLMEIEAKSAKLAGDVEQRFEWFRNNQGKRLVEAEEQTAREFDDAKLHARYGLPADQVRAIQATMEAAAQSPQDIELRLKAAEGAAILRQSGEDAENPDPMRLWHNMSGAQQAIFVFLNALGTAGRALSHGGGPTPMDVFQGLMDRDFQAQRDAHERRHGAVTEARTAYEIAARMTTNAFEREAMAKNLMMMPIEDEMRAAQLAMHVDTAAQQRQQYANSYAVQRSNFFLHRDLGTLDSLLRQDLISIRGAGAAPKFAETQKLSQAAQGLNTLSEIEQMWRENRTGAVISTFKKYAPFMSTPESAYNALRGIIAMSMLRKRGISGARMPVQEWQRAMQAIPDPGATESGAKILFDWWHRELGGDLNALLAAARAAGWPEEKINTAISVAGSMNPFTEAETGQGGPETGFTPGGIE